MTESTRARTSIGTRVESFVAATINPKSASGFSRVSLSGIPRARRSVRSVLPSIEYLKSGEVDLWISEIRASLHRRVSKSTCARECAAEKSPEHSYAEPGRENESGRSANADKLTRIQSVAHLL